MTTRRSIPLAKLPIAAAVRWGDLLFSSGIAPVDLATGRVRAQGTEQQARLVLDELTALLESQGTDLTQVLRVECFLAEGADFAAWNTAFGRAFPADPPARTTILVKFPIPDLLIEVQVVAGIPRARTPPSA
jgi:2-iminobutanoate/2-iminopropanoate deaminase